MIKKYEKDDRSGIHLVAGTVDSIYSVHKN